uniref:3-hydroxyisobutyrate dehydrogenase n=1 Tax=Rhabditophanes sp. KR3021 TaxID=114890 RepID=A0AC35TM47_9BILA
MSVGFIGLGNMGAFMAKNLIKNGQKLIVYDLNTKVLADFKAIGADIATHPADISAASKTIITMLPEGAHVKATFHADNGLLKNHQAGSIFIDSSTIAQNDALDLYQDLKKVGSTFIDAPVSGGTVGAQNGTLTFMVGADKKHYAAVKQLLQGMGKNIVDCGKIGNGQAAKICNNMLLAIHMIGVAETMNLGQEMGLDKALLAGILNTSTGRCWAGDTNNPVPGVLEGVPSSRQYSGGFGVALLAKDLGLAQQAATLTKSATPLGSASHQIYRQLANNPEYAGKDFGIVYQTLCNKSKQ